MLFEFLYKCCEVLYKRSSALWSARILDVSQYYVHCYNSINCLFGVYVLELLKFRKFKTPLILSIPDQELAKTAGNAQNRVAIFCFFNTFVVDYQCLLSRGSTGVLWLVTKNKKKLAGKCRLSDHYHFRYHNATTARLEATWKLFITRCCRNSRSRIDINL